MNTHNRRSSWSRLVAVARGARADGETSAPYGFATRVVALHFAQASSAVSVLDRLALRALGVAAALAVGSVLINYRPAGPSPATAAPVATEEHQAATDDAMAVLLDT
jgi:hypothetical protein